MVCKNAYIPEEIAKNKHELYRIINEAREEKKVCIEMIAFLINEDIDSDTILQLFNDYNFIIVGNKLIYNGENAYEHRKYASLALSGIIELIYHHIYDDNIPRVLSKYLSKKSISKVMEAR
jgi:hypothetical protein